MASGSVRPKQMRLSELNKWDLWWLFGFCIFSNDYIATAGKEIVRQEMYFGKQLQLQARNYQCNKHVLQISFPKRCSVSSASFTDLQITY